MAINEIVCIGDSLAMHDTENGIFTHDTYPYQIAELIPKFVMTVRNRRANTSIQQERNQNIYDDIHAYFPSVFIINSLGSGFEKLISLEDEEANSISPIDVDIDKKMNVFFIDGSQRIFNWNGLCIR